jgi:hypothetical protein
MRPRLLGRATKKLLDFSRSGFNEAAAVQKTRRRKMERRHLLC